MLHLMLIPRVAQTATIFTKTDELSYTFFVHLTGVGMGLCLQVGFSYFVCFFDKHFTFANMLSAASSGIGYLSIPPAIEFLISQY